MKGMKMPLSLAAVFLSFWLLSACNQAQDTDELRQVNGNEAEASASSQLADSLAITEATLGQVRAEYGTGKPLALVDTELKERRVRLTFRAGTDIDKAQAEEVAGRVLMEISKRTVDSKQLKDGYATVYNHYHVDILVQGTDAKEKLSGTMPAGAQQIEWKKSGR